eukprot:Plantae.Rhodophyta-Palmaria_palmata.ctg1024.p1 GENE.Plantae.Rhodophyta-Palmaria_palmata.ctg1024~~Plantae.Rhodophyta-Palmaria_palmata.ctg1024.p1  ORF type:complete len:117 (-),score=7.15 Plantae.Rhodophyta-Palmaria_palmata.ctg1024:328-678(-)
MRRAPDSVWLCGPADTDATGIIFLPDQSTVVKIWVDAKARICDTDTGRRILRLAEHPECDMSVNTSVLGWDLAVSGSQGEVVVWRPSTGKTVSRLTLDGGKLIALAAIGLQNSLRV